MAPCDENQPFFIEKTECTTFNSHVAEATWEKKTLIPTSNMKIHETIHTGEKAFCCVYRDETFKNYYSLRTMEEATQEKNPRSYQ